MKNEKDFRVVESNFLLLSSYRLSLSETKLLICMLNEIDINHKDFHQYKISIKHFIELQNKKRGDIYTIIDNLTDAILKHIVKIKEQDGSITKTSFMASCNYKAQRGYITFDIHPKLRDHLLRLTKHFSSYDVRNIINCNSVFSIRIYQILKTKQYLGRPFQIDIEEFKWMLKISNQYTRWGDLRRYVLDTAKKELKLYSDLFYSYKGIKEGRKYKFIEFTIEEKEQMRLFDGKDYIKNDEVLILQKQTEKTLQTLSEDGKDAVPMPDELKKLFEDEL
jgi:plasmid replication initiation protein